MHEFSIAQSIVEILHDQMRNHRLSRIESVRLRVGVLRSIEIGSLSFSFEALTAGSPLEGARLDVEEVPLEARCIQCSHQVRLSSWFDDCPRCGGPQMEIISGKELDIIAIDGE
jgi:hydrogenase nickel incorporation protein HypA/HybF